MTAVLWQPSLLGFDEQETPAGDPSFDGAARRFLGAGAWVDWVPGWLRGADSFFEQVLDEAPWQGTRRRRMYDRMVDEPRLSTGPWASPPAPAPALAGLLSGRYGLDLSAVSANLYRDGCDSVAWHGDTLGRQVATTVVAILSLGSARPFLLRPKGGGPSIRYRPGHGDLLVLGGTCQRTWDHSVPKVAAAGTRISIMFREQGVY
ncbi:MAG: alpha-ketoglutarate-dependent dioxygenase AlkB [Acidimicrobiia bacterium]|nr:alpha-ketoglutarate-dependent dioxygenase AlkB [Acidimicrobiia bacterium]